MFLLEDRILFDAAVAIDIADAANTDDQSDDIDNSSDNAAEQNADAFLQSPSEAQQAMPLPVNPYIDAVVRDALDGNLAALGLDGDFTFSAIDNNEQIQVLLISDFLDNADELYAATGDNTIAIRYDAANTTTEQLLEQIEQSLDGEKIDRLGIAQQSDSNGKIDLLTNDSDTELWTGLNNLMTDDASIDLFASDMADSDFTDALAELTGHEVNYSDDLTGTDGDWTLENGGIDLATTYFDGELAQNVNFSVIPAEPTHELAIINSSVMDVDDILDDLGDNVDILILDGSSDPFEQINDYLDANDATEYDAMHIISHGNDGYFVLNGQIIDGDYATNHAAEFAAIGEHLTQDGDIMIYGCDLAANTEGQSLVAQIADITGADVAASNDTTSNIGGNWNLEYSIGLIDSSSFNIEGYSYHLTDWSVTLATGTADGSLRYAIDNHAVAGDSISFNIDGTDTVDIGTTDIDITVGLSINGHNNGTGTDGTAGNSNVTVQVATPGENGTAARVFNVNASGATVNISNMTIKGGDISSLSGTASYGGGIILQDGVLNLGAVNIANSKASSGGGIAGYANAKTIELNITNSTISGNNAYDGGGIYNYAYQDNSIATLNITNSSISGNSANSGGGINNYTKLGLVQMNISYTVINNNSANSEGGGIYNNSTVDESMDTRENTGRATVDISYSTINNNNSAGSGGGVYNCAKIGLANIYMDNSTISSNSTEHYGGGIYNYDTLLPNIEYKGIAIVSVITSTISNNSADNEGGGICNLATGDVDETYFEETHPVIALYETTISGNSAGSSGGGIYISDEYDMILDVYHTIIAYNYLNDNSTYSDYTGTINNIGDYNIVGGLSAVANNINYSYTNGMGAVLFANYDTVLENTIYKPILADNGGNTFTVALADNSIAKSAGNLTVTNILDQRGVPRHNHMDIGSYEIATDLYFRTSTDGIWSNASNWEFSSDNTSWFDAVVIPDATNSLEITIYHDIALSTDVTIDQTVVTANGSLNVNSGQTLIIANGSGTDLTVSGSFSNSGTTTTNSGSYVLYDGGDQTIAALVYSGLGITGPGTTKTFADGITSVEHDIMIDSGSMTLTGSSSSNVTVQVADPGITQSRVFYIGNSNYPTATVNISNITIKGGDVSAFASPLNSGGAIYLNTGTLNLSNVVISDGKAVYGGGIATSGNTILNIANSSINNNAADSGGGIFSYGELNINNSTVDANTASSRGGGIDNEGYGTLNNVTVSNNQAVTGGGIINGKISLIINNSTIDSNYASRDGGGIATSYSYNGTMTITDSSIINNSSVYNGGGINAYGVATTIDNCLIDNNHAGYGGGIFNRYKDITITDSHITNNTAYIGAGIYNSYASQLASLLTRTNVEYNHASGSGGGIVNTSSFLNINCSTIAYNIADDGVGGIDNSSSSYMNIINSTIAYNNGTTTGGIKNDDRIKMINSTISNNSASTIDGAGGLYATGQSSNYLLNSIIINNSAPAAGSEDIVNDASTVTAYYSRLDSTKTNGTITADASNIDATYNNELGVLADNGGETKTMALLAGAPMLNAGTEAYYGDGAYFLAADGNYHQLSDYSIIVTPYSEDLIATDQRGVERGSSPDIGAYEYVSVYIRSHNDGNWSTAANWELLNVANSSWSTASVVPTAANINHVEIAHQITVNGTPDIDQLNISGHGELIVANGATLNILDGVGDDLRIDGKLTVNGSINNAGSIVNNGTINLTADSHFNYTDGDQNILVLNYSYLGLSGANSTKTFAAANTSVAHEIILNDAGMTIAGNSAATTTIQVTTPGSGGTVARVFHTNVGDGNTVTIENMTIKGGDISGLSGDSANGGTIFHESGTLNISNTTITGSKAVNGGGVYMASTLTLSASDISSTHSTNNGGGVYNYQATLTITSSTIGNNSADRSGGGVSSYRDITTTVENSTIFNNSAGRYAAILNYDGNLILLNSTISSNSSNSIVGGVGSFNGSISILDTTISNNTAAVTFGAVYNNRSQLYIVNSIVINNPLSGGGNDNDINTSTAGGSSYAFYGWYDGSKVSGSLNTNAGAPNLTSPLDGTLSALTGNGGSTSTMAVQAGSNIIGAGTYIYYNSIDGYYFSDQTGTTFHHLNYDTFTPFSTGGKITTDQRGSTRDPAFIPTMGAYEFNTSMVEDLPNGDEYSTDEFSDLLKVNQATENDIDIALLEFIA